MFNIKTIQDNLYVSGLPTKPIHFDKLQNRGITHVISLETRVDMEAFQKRNIGVSPHYFPDHTPLRPDFLWKVINELDQLLNEGHTLLVQDMGGRTRAGTVVAAYFVYSGYSPWRALRKIWWAIPSAKTPMVHYYQDQQVYKFYYHLNPGINQEEDFIDRFFKLLGFGKKEQGDKASKD